MLKSRIFLVSLLITAVGCSSVTGAYVKPESFSGKKTFAIVSMVSYPIVKSDEGSMSTFTNFDVVTTIGNVRSISTNAIKIFHEAHDKFIKKFSGNSVFTLVDEKTVLNNSAYKKAASGDAKSLLLADGYKFIKTKEQAAALAKALGVDAVITVNFRFSMSPGSSIGIGAAAITKRLGGTYINVTAYDQAGEIVWRDFRYDISKNGYTEPGSSSFSMKKLYPFLQESTDRALNDLFERLNKRIQQVAKK